MRASILHTGLAVLACLSLIEGATEYHGKLIGSLKTFYHGVTGDVYAVDARTLHIRNFNYDGEGPAAYFYVGSSKAINTNGQRLLDERGQAQPLKRYNKKHITLTLPEGKTLANVKWFSVWCDEFAVSFADIKIPKGLDFPKPQKIGALNGVHAVSSEPIVVVDAQTLLIPSFSYDGEAPDAKFWVGRGPSPSPQGIRVPDENGKEIPLRRYDRKTIVLTLPGDLTVFEIGHFGVWCEAFTVDFGHVQIPAQLNVPPSLKMLGVSPQKRSRSLQLSALQSPQQLQRDNLAHDKHFNYQNVLPLFNVQDTLRPTTYRPQLLVQPSTVDPQSLRGVDHRFSQKHTNGYLPLNNQRQFPPPTVQIIPSVSLNDDNGLISQNQFDLGPLNQQYYLDPNLYNQQIQYDQFRNGQPPFVINVQDEQLAYQRPIRKESDQPPTNTIRPKSVTRQASQQKQQRQLQQSGVSKVQNVQAQTVPQQQQQPELFQIPLLPQGAGVSISSAILAEEFQQTSVEQPQPIPRQATVPQPADILTVPQFVNNGFFSTDFGPSGPRPPPARPIQPARPTSRLRSFGSSDSSRKIVPFTNNPQGSFSRFVLSSGSGLHETLVKY